MIIDALLGDVDVPVPVAPIGAAALPRLDAVLTTRSDDDRLLRAPGSGSVAGWTR
jgi:hypothetical protein